MSFRVRRLAAIHYTVAANTDQGIYTVPAGKVAVLRGITIGNNNGSAVNAGILNGGAGYLWDMPLPAAGQAAGSPAAALHLPVRSVLHAGNSLAARMSISGQVYVTVEGAEFDAPPGNPELYRLDIHNVAVGGSTSPAIPAGKRYRMREIVIANHSTNADVNISIHNIVLLHREHLQAAKGGRILQVDVTLNPGEQIFASTSGTPVHVFTSGTLEDA